LADLRAFGAYAMQQPLPRIPDATLKNLIGVFYTRVRKDPVIGPVFNDAITDWEAHQETLFLFWTSLLYGNTGYNGRPVPAHFKHREHMTPAAFTRWLELWAQTTDDLLPQEIAALLQDRAACIGTSFQRAMAFQGAR
jgi:hemoglobin